jgi:XTP/dITP diphosphohydrolase
MTAAHGERLLDLVALMDRLRSPGGCPWDAQQTHESLEQYLVEETYEVLEAIDTGDRDALLEELGDLLLQVVFHARIAQERPEAPFSIDDVAAGITAKLVRRHPHVFAAEGEQPVTAAHTERGWDAIKRAEKGRTSALDGVPMAQPSLALAAKVLGRVERAGLDVPVPAADAGGCLGDRLLALVAEARREGVDAEAALRASIRRYAERVREAEAAG